MSYAVLQHHGLASLLRVKPEGALPFAQGLDLVIAHADFVAASGLGLFAVRDEHAPEFLGHVVGLPAGRIVDVRRRTLRGPRLRTETPDSMVMNLMASMGLAGPALVIVLLSTVTTTFLDIYSNAISALSIFPKLNERATVAVCGVAGTVFAVFFPATEYEQFLLFIGAMFCPLFGVVLTDYFVLKRMKYVAESLFGGELYRYTRGFNVPAILSWGAGFALYETAAHAGWACGASLPGMAGAGLIYLLFQDDVQTGSSP